MTKRQRTLLFFAAATLFLLTTPAVVLYSQGWRVDWDHKTVTHTGGVYVRVTPPRASIFVDDGFVKRSDPFPKHHCIPSLVLEHQTCVAKPRYVYIHIPKTDQLEQLGAYLLEQSEQERNSAPF